MKAKVNYLQIFRSITSFIIIGSLLFSSSISYAQPIKKDQAFFDAVKEYIDDNYALEVTDQQLYDEAVKGMFNALDPYSEYLTKDQYDWLKQENAGKLTGIGAVLGKNNTGFVIVSIMSGSPAEQAGLLAGDVISSVNKKPVDPENITLQKLVEQIRGQEGTTIELSILRNKEKKNFSIVRKTIQLTSVESKMINADVGYMRIFEFNENTFRETTLAIADLQKKGAKKLVLDLRGNPGGLLNQAVQISDYFVPKGKLLEVRYKKGEPDIFYSKGNIHFNKVAVLIDGNTASAAEILSGAIQDTKAGTLIGEKTFGKGIVQDVYELKNGEAIKMTIAKYYLPSGRYIHEVGITPDMQVQEGSDPKVDIKLNTAINLLTKN